MTGCKPHLDVIVLQDLKLGFRTEVGFTERTKYAIQPLGVELSCNVHTVHLQTGTGFLHLSHSALFLGG